MTLSPQEEDDIVEKRRRELFQNHIGQFYFCCLISWNFVMLYLFSLKSKNVFMNVGQMLFTTLYASVVKYW